jgi:hypothetical protein
MQKLVTAAGGPVTFGGSPRAQARSPPKAPTVSPLRRTGMTEQ